MNTDKNQVTVTNIRKYQLDEVPEGGIYSKTLFKTPHCTQTLMQFGADEELTEHTSKFAALLQFTKGAGTIVTGNEEHDIEPGLVVYMPPNLPHSVHTSEPTDMILTLLRG